MGGSPWTETPRAQRPSQTETPWTETPWTEIPWIVKRPYPIRLSERLGILSSGDNGGCGGAFTADNGVMISPNYPNPYPHNAQCVYTVTVRQNEVMNLTFTNLELEQPIGGSCEWDYVEVWENRSCTVTDLRGVLGTHAPSRSNFFHFHVVFGKDFTK